MGSFLYVSGKASKQYVEPKQHKGKYASSTHRIADGVEVCGYSPYSQTTPVLVELRTDVYPNETMWKISQNSTLLYQGGPYQDNSTWYNVTLNMCNDQYKICIYHRCDPPNVFPFSCKYEDGLFRLLIDDFLVYRAGPYFLPELCVEFPVPNIDDPPSSKKTTKVTSP